MKKSSIQDGVGGQVVDWNQYAENYDVLCSLMPYQELLATVSNKLKLRPGIRILDAACGTGNLISLNMLNEAKRDIEWCALDGSIAMLKSAQRKCSGSRANFFLADLNQSLAFNDGLFDYVVSINTLYALARPQYFLNECYRLLKPGGTMILVNPKLGYENGLILKAHCGDIGPDEPWLGMHVSIEREQELLARSVSSISLQKAFLEISGVNRHISTAKSYNFYDQQGMMNMLADSGFRSLILEKAYARQAIMAIAKK